MAIKRRPISQKNPPILSQDFFIQNHADIVSCVAILFVMGLLFNKTQQLASNFIVLGHNITDLGYTDNPLYTYGVKDFGLVFFYTLIAIVIHAVIQEYVLDKINKKLNLSKVKSSKFNESGQLLSFYIVSLAWICEIIRRDNIITNCSSIWTEYPHGNLTYLVKFFFIVQISYWLHNIPELYLQKVRREDWAFRFIYSFLYLALFIAAYLTNTSKIAILFLLMHYTTEAFFHFSRLFYFADKSEIYGIGFAFWNLFFIATRLISIVLTLLTFYTGLSKSSIEKISLEAGNFNTPAFRATAITLNILLQIWFMWNYINFHIKRYRENAEIAKQQQKKEEAALVTSGDHKKLPAIRKRR